MVDRPTRSLRARVAIAAALGTVVLAVVVAVVVSAALASREVAAVDRRLQVVAEVMQARLADGTDPRDVLGSQVRGSLLRSTLEGLVVTVRRDGGTAAAGLDAAAAPELPSADGTTTAGGVNYRVRTAALPGGGSVSVGLPTAAVDRTVRRVRQVTLLITVVAALSAAGLGWLLAGPAVRPLRELRDRTAALGSRPGPADRAALRAGVVGRTTETADLADALDGLLGRVAASRGESERALTAARDFAVAAEHELRTPLTAMRTDIEVLASHPGLPEAERREMLDGLAGRQERVETTLTALAQLAAGDLTFHGDRTPVELTDLVAQAVTTATRAAPADMEVTAVLPGNDIIVPGSSPGLRLALDNLLINALRHSGGTRVEVSVQSDGPWVRITVDDDGNGVPVDERDALFERFRRGTTARAPGSGLGLALVAQQAALHRGRARLTDSPLGGTRAVLDLPAG